MELDAQPALPQAAPLFTLRSTLDLVLPLMAEQALAVLVGVVDVMMISGVGEAAVSGIAVVNEINSLMIQLLSALATGGAVVASQYLGRRESAAGREAAQQLMLAVAVLSSALCAVSFVCNRGILHMIYGSLEPAVEEYAVVYYYFSAASYPFLGLYNAGAALFRSMGNSKVSMMTSLLMNVVHVLLNLLFIFVFRWGVAGAAASSMLSRMLAAGVMLPLLTNRQNAVWLEYRALPKLNIGMIKRILAIGIPNGIENAMFQIGRLMTQSIVAGLGTMALAAHAVGNNITNLSSVPGISVGLASITILGHCMGAGQVEQAAFNKRRLMKLAYALNVSSGLLLFALCNPIISIYGLEADTGAMARPLLVSYSIAVAAGWAPGFLVAYCLRAAGDVKFTMAVSITSMWLVRVGLSYVLVPHVGLMGVYWGMYADWAVRSIAFALRWRGGKWRAMRVI